MQYVVQAGDTLTIIAQKFGTTVDAIVRANNLSSPDLIFVGQVLVIPEGTTPAVPTPPSTPPPSIGLCPVLSRGSSGPAVRRLQTLLVNNGLDPGTVDGIFGAKTEAAVRSFQGQKGLPVTGVVDARTWQALGETCVGPSPVPPTPVPPIPVPPSHERFCPVLRLGSVGPAVRLLQNLLKERGIYTGVVDGDFGGRTLRAVREFQRQQGLTVTGVVDGATWRALGVSCGIEPTPPSGTPIATRVGRGLRHILFTNKRVYERGERVKITLSKTNVTNDEITLRYSTSQIIEITVTNAVGTQVWRYSAHRTFAQYSRLITIYPGGTQTIDEYWNQLNDRGNQVLPGTYTITVTNLATNVSLSVQIQIR